MYDFERIADPGAALGAGIDARTPSHGVCTHVTVCEPPTDPCEASTSWGYAIAWTVMVDVVGKLPRLFAPREAKALVA